MPKGIPDSKSQNNNNSNSDSEMIDKNINFDNRDMHKSWPLIKGCLMLFFGIGGFVLISTYVFRHFANWFN